MGSNVIAKSDNENWTDKPFTKLNEIEYSFFTIHLELENIRKALAVKDTDAAIQAIMSILVESKIMLMELKPKPTKAIYD